MASINAINNTCTAGVSITGGAVSIDSGTSAINISNDASATTVSFGTGAAVKTITLGSTNSTSATILKSGTGSIIGNSGWTINSSGLRLNAVQPACFADRTTAASNVTGDGTVYTVVFSSTLFDQNSNFNTGTGVFTAPVTGKYWFYACVTAGAVAAGNTTAACVLVTTAHTFSQDLNSPAACYTTVNGNFSTTLGILAPMTAGDTAYFNLVISGGTKIVSANGSSAFLSSIDCILIC